MYAAAMIRDLKMDEMRRAQLTVRHILEVSDPATLTQYRDDGLGWTVAEVLCHLRDFESIFLDRARLTAKQEFPDQPFPDPYTLAVDHHYEQEDAWLAYEDWFRRRRGFLEYLNGLPEEAWDRRFL